MLLSLEASEAGEKEIPKKPRVSGFFTVGSDVEPPRKAAIAYGREV